MNIKIKNILHLYFFKSRVIGKHGRKNIWGCWKGPKIIVFDTMKGRKKIIINVSNLLKIIFHILEFMKMNLISWIIYVMLNS
jgi:hypothetical protein